MAFYIVEVLAHKSVPSALAILALVLEHYFIAARVGNSCAVVSV